MTTPTREMARVIAAVAKGDLTQSVTLEVEGRPLQGEFLRAGKTVNPMVEQLSAFTAEVTRVAREVGPDGKLGGQARVRGVSGPWNDLTDNVNPMAANLTAQVRGSARVVTAVANGNLKLALRDGRTPGRERSDLPKPIETGENTRPKSNCRT